MRQEKVTHDCLNVHGIEFEDFGNELEGTHTLCIKLNDKKQHSVKLHVSPSMAMLIVQAILSRFDTACLEFPNSFDETPGRIETASEDFPF